MPNKDGTGPKGEGSKTGRQMGNCKESEPSEGSSGCKRGFREVRKCCRRRTGNCVDEE